MKLIESLKEAGLSVSEAKVYLFLLEHGISSPPEITNGTKIQRGNLHQVLSRLLVKGLVRKQAKSKRYAYLAEDPSKVLQLVETTRKNISEALPDLTALHKKQKSKPVIKFYDGKEEVMGLFFEVLETKAKEILGFASTKQMFEAMPEYDFMAWQKTLRKRKIFLRDILSHSSKKFHKMACLHTGHFAERRYIDESFGEVPNDILIWDNKVAIASLNEPFFGTVIENEDLANTYRIQFEIMWRALPKEKKV